MEYSNTSKSKKDKNAVKYEILIPGVNNIYIRKIVTHLFGRMLKWPHINGDLSHQMKNGTYQHPSN